MLLMHVSTKHSWAFAVSKAAGKFPRGAGVMPGADWAPFSVSDHPDLNLQNGRCLADACQWVHVRRCARRPEPTPSEPLTVACTGLPLHPGRLNREHLITARPIPAGHHGVVVDEMPSIPGIVYVEWDPGTSVDAGHYLVGGLGIDKETDYVSRFVPALP